MVGVGACFRPDDSLESVLEVGGALPQALERAVKRTGSHRRLAASSLLAALLRQLDPALLQQV